jgi:hypothetical protein
MTNLDVPYPTSAKLSYFLDCPPTSAAPHETLHVQKWLASDLDEEHHKAVE